MPEGRPLETDPEARRDAAERALTFALKRFLEEPQGPVQTPVDPERLHELLDEPLPRQGQPVADVVADVGARIAPHCRSNGHPRMFGYVSASGTWVGALADLLTGALNQNVTSWRSAPGPTEVERLVVRWIAEILGYPSDSAGLLMSGGSMANFAGLAAALYSRAGPDLKRRGLRTLEREPVVYTSEMTHMSIAKACEMLGLGADAVRLVPVREDYTLDVEALERAIDEDAEAGRWPLAVVANAGDVNTGAFDPLEAIAGVCERRDVWLHVDAAYGGFAALAESVRPRFEAIGRADSVALDPHKWLYVPLDAGCLLVKDPAALRAAFSHGAEYVEVLDKQPRSDFAFWDYGPELSRRFRALKVWMQLKHHGVDGLGEAVERNVELAGKLAERVDAAEDFERLAPAPLSIVCFRYVPPAWRSLPDGDRDARLNELNRELVVRVQRGGESYLSNAVLRGKFALRACIVNYRTQEEDLDILLDTLRKDAAAVLTLTSE